MKIDTDVVKSKSLYYKSFYGDDNAYVTMTEWANGEGYDVSVSCNGEKHISMTSEEFDALIALYHAFNLTDPE